jgi:hypothetical protein
MKKIIIIFLTLFSSCSVFSQIGISPGSNPHDSILFDGSVDNYFNKQDPKKSCWTVKHVWGNVIGTREKIIERQVECGSMKNENIKYIYTTERGQMKAGDVVYEKDNFEIGEGSMIQLELKDASGNLKVILTFSGCNDLTIPSCEPNDFEWQYKKGKYFWKSYDWNLHYIGTQNCSVKNLGTMYSLETNDSEDIIKVYEGSVTITPKKLKSSANDELQKLSEDYQNGKISLEEFMSKSKSLSEQMLNDAGKITSGITVEAGYQTSVGDKSSGDIVPISTDDDKWWDNENYNK